MLLRDVNIVRSLIFVVLQIGSLSKAFNIDISSVQIYRGPLDSMFGFTVAQHFDSTTNLSWSLIGAPKADGYQPGVERGGAVFRCKVVNTINDDTRCEMVGFDRTGNQKIENKEIGFKSGQMLGATLKSSDDDSVILACAPRYSWRTTNKSYVEQRGTKKPDQPVGTCFVSSGSFDKFMEYSPCRTNHNQGRQDSGYCQVGLGADLAKDGRRTYCGTVGRKNWHGGMVAVVKADESVFGAQSQFENAGYYQFFAPSAKPSAQALPKILSTSTATTGLNDEAYLGYSVATGEFDGDSISDAVAGMPRGEHLKGMVLVFNSDLVELRRFTGEQIGAYFGYSLCVLDLDGDGRDDIVVGAPLFSDYKEETRGDEIGRVYIYYQTEMGKFERSDTLSDGIGQPGRFGLSLASLSDLNADGFSDLAIGAPYGGPNEQGAVYIYNGGQSGINKQYSQVVHGSDPRINLRAFGFSISGGKDLDGNGYPDLLVGAYDSDSAAYFRSVPVVRVLTKLTFEPEIISLDTNCRLKSGDLAACSSVRACMTYEGHRVNSQLDFILQFTLDSKKRLAPRLFYRNDEGNHSLRTTVRLELSQRRCFNTHVYLRENITDKKTSLDVDFQYSLRDTSLAYLIDKEASKAEIGSAFIMRNCGPQNVCVPDLGLAVSQSDESYVLGTASRLWIEVVVSNSRNDSHGSTVSVQLPVGLSYQNVELVDNNTVTVLCSILKARVIKCDVGDPLPANTSVMFRLFFQVSRMDSLRLPLPPSLEMTVTANSTDPEVNLENNFQLISIPIDVKTKLQAYGSSRPTSVIYNATQHDVLLHKQYRQFHNTEIAHTYEVKNDGPSRIEEASIHILWPSLTQNGNPLLYLLDQPILEGPGKCDLTHQANPLNLTFSSRMTPSPSHSAWVLEDSDDDEAYSSEAESISAELDNLTDYNEVRSSAISPSTTMEPETREKLMNTMHEPCGANKCIRIICRIGPLTGKSAFIHLRGLIHANTLKLLSSKGLEKLIITSQLTGQVTVLPYNLSPKNLRPVMAEIVTKVELNFPAVIPWWAYLLIILSGIFILLLISVLLYKSGFFKRARPAPTSNENEPEKVGLKSESKTIDDTDKN